MRVKCQIGFLAKKPLTLCNRWSTIEEPLRFLDSFETDKKKDVLMEKIDESFKFSSWKRHTLLRWLCEDLNILQNQEAFVNY